MHCNTGSNNKQNVDKLGRSGENDVNEFRKKLLDGLKTLEQKIQNMSPDEVVKWVDESECKDSFKYYAKIENAMLENEKKIMLYKMKD